MEYTSLSLLSTKILIVTLLAMLAVPIAKASPFPTSPELMTRGLSPVPLNDTEPLIPSICTHPPRNSCAFYPNCLESKYHCGPDGYPIRFGENICERIRANQKYLSTEGQAWMLDAIQCLQKELVPEVTSNAELACSFLGKKALASHGPCFVDSGICTLSPSDWVVIVGSIQLKNAFYSPESFLATLHVGEGCLKAYLSFLLRLIL